MISDILSYYEIYTLFRVFQGTLLAKLLEHAQKLAGPDVQCVGQTRNIGDFRTDFQPEGVMLVMSYQDRPGMLGKIGTILGEAGVNIASMNLGRREKAGEAMVVFSLDSGVDEGVLKQLSKAVNASFVRVVDMM